MTTACPKEIAGIMPESIFNWGLSDWSNYYPNYELIPELFAGIVMFFSLMKRYHSTPGYVVVQG